tara:strand:- start:37 stop:504 length:468 start_codon:yes stop_codon:yes gene_type:complete
MTKMKLSKNLSLAETIRSATAMRHGIENNPTPEHIVNLMSIAENIFQPVRDYLGRALFVSSGYRSAELNSLINGSKTSQHLVGSALDLDNGDDNYTVFHYIKDNLDFDQLIWEFGDKQPNWIHVSYVGAENRNQILRAYKLNGKTKYELWKNFKG